MKDESMIMCMRYDGIAATINMNAAFINDFKNSKTLNSVIMRFNIMRLTNNVNNTAATTR